MCIYIYIYTELPNVSWAVRPGLGGRPGLNINIYIYIYIIDLCYIIYCFIIYYYPNPLHPPPTTPPFDECLVCGFLVKSVTNR